MTGRLARVYLRFVISGAVVIMIWYLIWFLVTPPSYILPSPSAVAAEFLNHTGYYSKQLMETTLTSAAGLVLGIVMGAVLAFVSALFPSFSPAVETGSVALRTIPIVALAPIITMWFGTEASARTVVSGIICFFPFFSSLRLGLDRVESTSLLIFKIYGATRWQTFVRLRLPSAVPLFTSAIPMSTTLAVLGALVAEFCGSDVGLGLVVLHGLYLLNASILFVAMILSAVLGILFYLGGRTAEVLFERYLKATISVQGEQTEIGGLA